MNFVYNTSKGALWQGIIYLDAGLERGRGYFCKRVKRQNLASSPGENLLSLVITALGGFQQVLVFQFLDDLVDLFLV